MIRTEEEHLAHYGILRRSGRYPWGSGGTENVRNRSFLDIIDNHRKSGMTDTEIARGYGITTTQLRAALSIANDQQRHQKQLTAWRLREKGWSHVKIGERMNLNESSVRALIADKQKDKVDSLQNISKMLKDQVAKKKYVQIGSGVENQIGITQTKLNTAVAILREQGYQVHNIYVKQVGTGKFTTLKVLAPPGTKKTEVERNRSEIQLIDNRSVDHGRTFDGGMQPPISVSSRRIGINYAKDGGDKADGVIYIRKGVNDLSIGSNQYAQVRVLVDGTHYLKGMAHYKDDLPAGVDLVFNTNKSDTGRKKDVMKAISSDPDNPFGAIVRQVKDSKGKVSSAMNLVNEQGDWDKWSRNLSSQVLSKQSPDLARKQLNLTFERRVREFNEINSLTNPTVRQKFLEQFAEQTDAASVHLKAAALVGQSTKVILPIASIKEHEIYAPSIRDGERVALVRHPHGGTFEIPQLTVNNRNREARKIIGTAAVDAVGIHHKVAQHLSGADFDGDFVLVIPNRKKSIDSTPALKDLKNFDPQVYKIPKGSHIPSITPSRKQQEMGKVSNLITDMTLRGAGSDHLARAIKHSMVVIDSEKHDLDFLQSEKDHGILALKEEYQGGKKAGALTLISKARSPIHLPERRLRSPARGGPVDLKTGKKIFEPTGRMVPELKRRTDPATGRKVTVETGKMVPRQQEFKKLAVTDDASSLSSGTHMETIYAEHSNKLKAMANNARKEAVHIKPALYSPSAKGVYKNEVASLNAKLNIAKRNRPLEKQAQLLAQASISAKRRANPGMEKDEVKKLKTQELNNARIRTGAKKEKIVLTQGEWNAIQSGAISTQRLKDILDNSDIDTVKQLAMPRHAVLMTSSMQRRAKSMLASGYTQAEVADHLGVGLTTLKLGISE